MRRCWGSWSTSCSLISSTGSSPAQVPVRSFQAQEAANWTDQWAAESDLAPVDLAVEIEGWWALYLDHLPIRQVQG